MLRFSHFDVPVGQVPSAGNALTGRRSPWLAIMIAGDALHEIGGIRRHRRRYMLRGTRRGRHWHLVQVGERRIDGIEVLLDHRAPRLL